MFLLSSDYFKQVKKTIPNVSQYKDDLSEKM